MPWKASTEKRKRSRPRGASKPEHDASSHAAPENNSEPDAEERARPKKRARNTNPEDVSAKSTAVGNEGSLAQPPKVGRTTKKSRETAGTDMRATTAEREKYSEADTGPQSKNNLNQSKSKRKAAQSDEARGDEEPQGSGPPSSEPGRSGRGRGLQNSDVLSSGRKAASLQDQTAELESISFSGTVAGALKDKKKARTGRENAREALNSLKDDGASGLSLRRSGRNRGTSDNYNILSIDDSTKSRKPAKEAPPEATSPRAQKDKPTATTAKRTRGLPAVNNGNSEAQQALQSQQGNRATRKSSKISQPVRESVSMEESSNLKRRGQPGQAISPSERELPFLYLEERTKRIPRSLISEKWKALDGPSINAVGFFIADAQRSVLLRLHDTSRRREHASVALSGISRRLRAKLVKGLPFPAPAVGAASRAAFGNYEDEFNFESVMDAVQALENNLNPLLHSVGLLEREIKREENALAKDYDSLHNLEANAKAEANGWREKVKREHVLASGIKRKGEDGDVNGVGAEHLEVVARPEDDTMVGLFKDLDDEVLITLSKQISSHMESMQGNLQQIDGVVPAIVRTQAALQQLVLNHVDEEEYNKVLLG